MKYKNRHEERMSSFPALVKQSHHSPAKFFPSSADVGSFLKHAYYKLRICKLVLLDWLPSGFGLSPLQ